MLEVRAVAENQTDTAAGILARKLPYYGAGSTEVADILEAGPDLWSFKIIFTSREDPLIALTICWPGIAFFVLQVGVDHRLDQFLEFDLGIPAKLVVSFAGVAG